MSEQNSTELRAIQAKVSQCFGLEVGPSRLQKVVERRLERGDWSGLADYLAYVESEEGHAELESLAVQFCVAESYFFRNDAHFAALARTVLPRLISDNQTSRRLRVLSAGCSTGEEPYSLAVGLREALDDPDGWDLEIVAVDLNSEVIDKARQGSYRPWSLRTTPEPVRQRYFEADAEEFILAEDIRAMVSFERRNLLDDDPGFWRHAWFDLVFCRNTLMYFSSQAFATTVARFEQVVRPGGFLFLGHAESLRGLSTDFEVCRDNGTYFYRREGQAQIAARPARAQSTLVPQPPAVPEPRAQWFDLIEQSSARVARLTDAIDRREQTRAERNEAARASTSQKRRPSAQRVASTAEAGRADAALASLAPVWKLMSQERYDEALERLEQLDDIHDEPQVLLLEASLLTNRGDFERAQDNCRRLLEIGECCAGAYYLLALCREQCGEWEQARACYHQAIALDDTFAMPLLHLGLLARRSGDEQGAREALGRARDLIEAEDSQRILLFGGGFSRQALLQLCQSELRASRGRL